MSNFLLFFIYKHTTWHFIARKNIFFAIYLADWDILCIFAA